MTGYAFHAAPPPGEWLNDPNGLAFANGRYELFAQHSLNGPNGDDVGWARLVSDDLLSWKCDGIAISPDDTASAYSGSLVMGPQGCDAFFTRHDPRGPWQTQHRASGPDWKQETLITGPEGRNCRDPFVFHDLRSNEWRMLVAEPCDWSDWRTEPPSRISLWRSDDLQSWTRTGQIGPWHPPGIMWEVPVTIDFGTHQALVLSLVDRRRGHAECSVRYWLGNMGEATFYVDPKFPKEGLLLDHGPNFYAAIPNLANGWPNDAHVLVGWASNWEVARTLDWPDGIRGGPISLPRTLTLDVAAMRLRQMPIPQARHHVCEKGSFTDVLELPGIELRAARDQSLIIVQGRPAQRVDWLGMQSTYTLFRDANLFELFIWPEGGVVSVAVSVNADARP